MKKQLLRKTCLGCGTIFDTYNQNKKYCTRNCVHNYCTSRAIGKDRYPGLSRVKVGAVSELVACVDLMAKGYEVFRALSPACSCDLVILKNGELQRVEVKTGYIQYNGKVIAPNANIRADILAVVLHDKIVYTPSLEQRK